MVAARTIAIPNLTILRSREQSKTSTYGLLQWNGVSVLKFQEPQNCIPQGTYKLKLWDSKDHQGTVVFYNPTFCVYEVEGQVPDHTPSFISYLIGRELQVGLGYMYDKDPFKGPSGLSHTKAGMEKLRDLWGNRADLTALVMWTD